MKQLIIIAALLFSVGAVHAQTWDEIFAQKKTQKKYLAEQIAALQVYAGYLQKGYMIARDGINTVQSIRKGDFNLHSNILSSLGIANPNVKHYVKVAAIITIQIGIAKKVSATIKQVKNSGQLYLTETNYLQSVFNRLLDDCGNSLNELSDVIGNGRTQMKDDERINRIDAIYAGMQDKQVFVQSFSRSTIGLTMQRSNEEMDVIISKRLNGFK